VLSIQILCGIFHFLALFLYSTAVRHAVSEMPLGTPPISYFTLAENAFSLIYKLYILRAVWMRKQLFLQIINFTSVQLEKEGPERKKASGIDSFPFISALCTFSTIISLLRLQFPSMLALSEVKSRDGIGDGFLSEWYNKLVTESKYIFFLQNHACYRHFLPSCNNSTMIPQSATADAVLAGVTLVALCCKFIMGSFGDLIILMYGFSLSSRVEIFTTTLQTRFWRDNNDDGDGTNDTKRKFEMKLWRSTKAEENIVKAYKSLQLLAKLLNEAVGDSLIFFIGEGVFEYAMNSNTLFLLDSRGIVRAYFYGCFVWFIYTACGVSRKVSM